jgi:hypothetical protein
MRLRQDEPIRVSSPALLAVPHEVDGRVGVCRGL